ncbi:FecCD family ABC transporter permease [Nocardioides marmotae]|uniref:FecCD family ABC transporter permease n=1 Tax=Nocardioides marmotae TaxID=2663857 RepID=UPI0012B5262B|nr:iron chelate uptake ABC transporter family permease subunit [Nocardioides marmotae]MBC9733219.1 iron chelate uptake ABC transporter family permease subunit [Nocardioides marmotae]MTB84330.1 iron chelate uptake ABC transporter family permease subunit [Nocardioides marmotae]
MTELARRPAQAGGEGARRGVLLAGAALAVLLLGVASICVGTRSIAPVEALRAFLDVAGTDDHVVVREIRLPRTLLAVIVGAALATAGALIQTLTRNPLAEPGILGVTAGAGFAIVLAQTLWQSGSQVAQLAAALVGALLATVAVYAVGRDSPVRLLLAGVALSSVLAGLSLGIRLLRPEVFDNYRFWAVGSLAGREQTPLTLPVLVVVVALVGALLLSRPLDALALGEHVAHALGAHVVRTRVLVVVLVTVLAGAATAVAGPIAFVGLIVPHVARRLARGSVPWLLGFSLLLGPALLLAADVLGRLLLPTGEVPVAIVTAFLGAPVLIWVVRRYGTVAL